MSSNKPTTPYSQREQGYREKALKMYPWVCGRCAREFSGKRLSELTVHHKDHNHDNNPEDGSNWELLCLYCHDNEHSRYTDNQYQAEARPGSDLGPKETFKAFANLADLLKGKQS
ncbi:MAG TPA: HNH nuclease family protein [Pseudomonas sp.]|jgi:5-methylcytosine-specific restriction endonuclease McrA|uniref:YajD family HNH nuclease n=1 Tax=Stutzerimonas stutzeri group TaxID=136846 RepID=UPI0007BA27B1|nr:MULTISPECIES: YajD family HNH nuclease [Stutzerimonas stutzeri group]MBA4724515.1 HNH nuclease family protein [Pseudomonas sp.]MEC7472519.1 YajD family HNH nuclease [Pseudomonadota bacterium]KZX51126.1 restriction endonuclease [Stutzerimonas frequens]MBK3917629.1 HNH nuclease family protein [Stutzerimonas frequens]NCT79481.1 HNH nuclease family protein [Stutzerimonas stutzeri]|tara:strand:+ start:8116 stop:8460 length:345 start_codon:yes stop_codon:yes gene_type:complete